MSSHRKGTDLVLLDDVQESQEEVQVLPLPRIRGRFSLYDLPDGGIHVAWLGDGMDEPDTQHMEIPGKILKLAQKAAEGKLNPIQIVKEMMGG